MQFKKKLTKIGKIEDDYLEQIFHKSSDHSVINLCIGIKGISVMQVWWLIILWNEWKELSLLILNILGWDEIR